MTLLASSITLHGTSHLQSRTLRMLLLPEEFDAIADVGQPLHNSGHLVDLRVTGPSNDAARAQRVPSAGPVR